MPKDILLVDFELAFSEGDFLIGESTQQHQQLLLLLDKGALRGAPTRGVGLLGWLLDDQSGNLNGAIKREFEADGMVVQTVQGTYKTLQIAATYGC